MDGNLEAKHQDWDYQLFDNSYLSSRRWRCEAQIAEYMKHRQYAGVSDLMRYEILLEQGGFLPEADSICLRSVDELFVLPSLYTAYEHETNTALRESFLCILSMHPRPGIVFWHKFSTNCLNYNLSACCHRSRVWGTGLSGIS